MKNLTLEINPSNVNKENTISFGKGVVSIFGPGDQEGWVFKVKVSETQAIVAFSKFGILGVGFLVEKEDGNTNLPYDNSANKLYEWIKCNKGDDAITDETCLGAIKMIQKACKHLKDLEMQPIYEVAMANESYLKGKNGKILSMAQFKETSHVAVYGTGKRKRFVVMTKYNSDISKYEYLIGIKRCQGIVNTQAQALKFARKLLIERSANGREDFWRGAMYIKRNKEDGIKIPISF